MAGSVEIGSSTMAWSVVIAGLTMIVCDDCWSDHGWVCGDCWSDHGWVCGDCWSDHGLPVDTDVPVRLDMYHAIVSIPQCDIYISTNMCQ